MALTAEELNRAAQLFKHKEWNTDSTIEQSFDRFCETLSILSPEQVEMIFDLTDNFLRIGDIEYNPRIRIILDTLLAEGHYADIDTFYVMPLVDVMDPKSWAKSGNHVIYHFEQDTIKEHQFFREKNLFVAKSFASIPKNFADRNAMVIVVDDFIGSGESAITTLEGLQNERTIPVEKILFVSIVIQKTGFEALVNIDVKVAYDELRVKGITESYQEETRGLYVNLMREIEDMLHVKDDYKFGRHQTEALVKMMRIANNTFPVYWAKTTTSNNQEFVGTFPRS